MNESKPQSKTFPQVEATSCACCGLALPTGRGYEVPFIGAVGPQCVRKFAAFVQLLTWVEGRSTALPEGREAQFVGHSLVVGLRNLGFEVARDGDTLHVTRLTRKPAEVARSWKKRRAEFEQNLKVAAGLFGEDAQRARLGGVAA